MTIPLSDCFLECALWQRMLDRESALVGGGCIGLLRREDFSARSGCLLIFQGTPQGMRASMRAYLGEAGGDVAVLLVADAEAMQTLQQQGLAALRRLVRQGRLDPYMLKTMDQLEQAGLADFVEDLGLTFPKH